MVYGVLLFNNKKKIICFDKYYNSSANNDLKNDRSFLIMNKIID